MGSLDRSSIVNRLREEMDELHQMQYSAEFSTDVNRKMQIPTRISMEPEQAFQMDTNTPISDLNLDIEGSPAHAMKVPDTILIAGSDQHVGVRQAPRDLEEMTPFPQPSNNVGLTTPPRTLTLEEFSFPTVGDAKSTVKKQATGHVARHSVETNSSVLVDENSLSVESAQTVEFFKLQRRVHLLSSKIGDLEEANRRHEKRQQIFMTIGIVYLLFKGLRFLFRSPYP